MIAVLYLARVNKDVAIFKREHEEHVEVLLNIISNPNVGKSTLMNAFVGIIIALRPRATGHRIFLGIVNETIFR
jgi:predicted GTPase